MRRLLLRFHLVIVPGLLTALPPSAARADFGASNPPATAVWSGEALNNLLGTIQRLNARGVRGPTVPLDGEMLKHVNVSTGTTAGSLGLLRDGGTLHWPLALQGPDFAADRRRLEELAAQAYGQAHAGLVSAELLRDLAAEVDALQAELKERVARVEANEYIQGKRFLNDFEDTLKVLEDPNVAKLAGGQWSARGWDVYELVQNMTRDGLHFAPATRGDEPYYTALGQALTTYLQAPCPPASSGFGGGREVGLRSGRLVY